MYIFYAFIVILLQLNFIGISHGQLNATSVAEGECIVPTQQPTINIFWFLARRTYFIPVASQYAFRNYAEAFLGRPANSTGELGRMCLKVFIAGLRARTYGYNRIIDQSCRLTSRIFTTFTPGQLTCRVDNASPGTKTSLFNDYMDNVVMTDNQSYVLYVRCVNGVRDYKVLSIVPEISEAIYAEIRRTIISMGFNPDLMQRLICNGRQLNSI